MMERSKAWLTHLQAAAIQLCHVESLLNLSFPEKRKEIYGKAAFSGELEHHTTGCWKTIFIKLELDKSSTTAVFS